MKILAIDFGTNCGFAYNPDGKLFAGTWCLATDGEVKNWGKSRLTRRADPRIHRLYSILRTHADNPARRPDLVVFEDVEFSTFTYSTQMWASLRTAMWCAFGDYEGVKFDCLGVSALKKFATGSGFAKKPAMADALLKYHPEWKTANFTSDAVDALWLWYWAERVYERN